MRKGYVSFSDQMRKVIKDCKLTRYRIGKETGIDQATLTRFMLGERGLTMKTLEVLAEFLEIHIVAKGPRKPIKKRKG